MKQVILILALVIFIIGCAEKECKIESDCLVKGCQQAQCINNKCEYSLLNDCCGNDLCEVGESYPECAADCPNCDDDNKCTDDSFDFHAQECNNKPIIPCCGNMICDMGSEDYTTCSADCLNCDDNNECTNDSYDYHEQECVNAPIQGVVCCSNGVCELGETYETCTLDCPNCDDESECTEDSFDYHKHECVNELQIPCCGNEICDEGVEEYSNCSNDCPNCDDNDKLTGDRFNYETQECEYVQYYFYDDFNDGTISWFTDSKKGPDPRWIVEFPEDETNGVLTKVDEAESAFSNFGNRSWTDYIFRYKVKLEEDVVNAYVRAKFGQEGAYGISVSQATLLLWKDTEGPGHLDLESKKYSFEVNQFYDIKIEAKSNNLKVYVDDNLEIDYTDTDNPILSGNVGLEIIKNGYFDDIIVEAPR